jgi:hypothetical protein
MFKVSLHNGSLAKTEFSSKVCLIGNKFIFIRFQYHTYLKARQYP